MGVIIPVFESLNTYTPNSIMGADDPFKGPLSVFMTCSENYIFNTNVVNISLPKIIP